jgi:RNA polymerase sigma factor (sigma-70 family)
MSMDDDQLLEAYVTERSEAAFRALVQRHLPVVQGVARRQPGIDAHLAADVSQRVFIALARKAHGLREHATLVGWLYLAARLEAARVVRAEARRRVREATAGSMPDSSPSDAPDELPWEQLQPVLDDALAQLGEAERTAVLLRFFSGRSFAEVGRGLKITEEAARKRVERAVEKLRQALGRRGIVSTASALCATLGAHAAPAVGQDAVETVVSAAWQQAALGPMAQLGIFMSSTKLTVTAAGAVLLLAGASLLRDHSLVKTAEQRHAATGAELAALIDQRDRGQRELAALQRAKAEAVVRAPRTAAAPANQVRTYLRDPEYRAVARTASLAKRHLEFQRFYRQLQLSPDQIERFEDIMARQDQALLDGQYARDIGEDEQVVFRRSGPEWASAMVGLLGADGKRQLEDYLRSMSIRSFVDAIAARSYESGDPITFAQASQVIAVALANDPMYQRKKGTDPGNVNWNAVWEPAAKFLSPEQLVTFESAVEVWSLQKRISLAKSNPADQR